MSAAPFPWLYKGIWGVLSGWFRVPTDPPTLPATDGDAVDVFRADPGYLRYCRIGYWLGFALVLAILIGGLTALTVAIPPIGILLSLPVLVVFVFLSVLNYVALYLSFDTTWYAVGKHSIRKRSGVWTNREVTVNYDNVQNVSLSQGPLQRRFGIADVRIDTAGLQGGGNQYETARAAGVLLQGLSNAEAIKRAVQERCDASKSAGLGDEERSFGLNRGEGWAEPHLSILREIRDAAKDLVRDSAR